MNEQNIQRLREILVHEFNEDELGALCHDIGLNYADLPGMGPYGKTREIITAVQVQHTVRTLMNRVQQLRPAAYKEAGLETADPDKPPAAQPQSGPASRTTTATAATAMSAAASTSATTGPTPATGASAALAPTPMDSAESPSSTTQIDSPDVKKEADKTMSTGPRPSALPLRVRLIGFIIVVLLLAVAALSIVLQPRKGGSPVSVPPTTAVTLLPAAGPLTTTTQLTQSMPAAAAATPQPVVAEDTPTPTGTISETHPAAAAIRSINNTLVAFYMGKAKAEDFKPDFAAAKYQIIINFAYKTLKTKLGADLSKGEALNVTLRYDKAPTLTAEKNGVATVVTKEYWVYSNPANSKSYCDNSEYTYTLSKVGDVYQIKDFKSRAISSKCEQ